MPKRENLTQLIKEFRSEVNAKLDAHDRKLDSHSMKLDSHTADIIDLKQSVLGALDGVKLSIDKLAPLEGIPERTTVLERDMIVVKLAIKGISATK